MQLARLAIPFNERTAHKWSRRKKVDRMVERLPMCEIHSRGNLRISVVNLPCDFRRVSDKRGNEQRNLIMGLRSYVGWLGALSAPRSGFDTR